MFLNWNVYIWTHPPAKDAFELRFFYNCASALSYSREISTECLRIWNWTVDSLRRRNLKLPTRKKTLCRSNVCHLFCKKLNDNAYKRYIGYNFNKNIFKVLNIEQTGCLDSFFIYLENFVDSKQKWRLKSTLYHITFEEDNVQRRQYNTLEDNAAILFNWLDLCIVVLKPVFESCNLNFTMKRLLHIILRKCLVRS